MPEPHELRTLSCTGGGAAVDARQRAHWWYQVRLGCVYAAMRCNGPFKLTADAPHTQVVRAQGQLACRQHGGQGQASALDLR